MRFLEKSPDGGPDSPVVGYWLIEIKWLFSIVLLKFPKDSAREVYHSHAFNALTWWLKGRVLERCLIERLIPSELPAVSIGKFWSPSFIPKFTPRSCVHKIQPLETTWALSIRGPWDKTWTEFDDSYWTTLTHGRKVVKQESE